MRWLSNRLNAPAYRLRVRPWLEMLEDRLTPAAVAGITPSPNPIIDATIGSETFSLTVEYDAAMNTAVNPTISFPTIDENPSTTLTFSSGAWSDSTHYVAKYNVADTNVRLLNIDVKVSGGEADNATVPADFTANNTFGIDTQNPTVVSVTPSVATITEAQVGANKFVLTVVFSEAMNTGLNPIISFPVENPATTLTFASGFWKNNTTYEATHDVADANANLASVDVRVTGAKDAEGNIQVQGDIANNFSIDTGVPTVANLTVKRRIVADNLVGKRTFVIDVQFSEAIDQTVKPLVTFPVEKPGATLRHQSGAWRNSTTYRDIFNVRDIDVLLDKIDIRVTGAKDAHGSAVAQFDKANFFRIDTRNPTIIGFRPIGFDAGSGILRYGLIFDLPVTGLDVSDFRVEAAGLSGANIDAITGSGTQYQISVYVGSGFGQLRLKLIDDDSIRFLQGRNRLEGNQQADGVLATDGVTILRFGGMGLML